MTVFDPEKLKSNRELREAVLSDLGLPSSSDILVRLVRYLGDTCAEVLARPDHLSAEQKMGVQRAAAGAPVAIGALHDLIVDQTLSRDQKEDLLFALAKLVDDSLEVGFYFGLDRKSIMISERVIQERSAGGRATRKHVEEWRKLALPIAQSIRVEHPEYTDSSLIKELEKRYGSLLPVLPGRRQLQTWVSSMVNDGKLSAGYVDGRSKKVRQQTSSMPKSAS